jgi:hypothetical protein
MPAVLLSHSQRVVKHSAKRHEKAVRNFERRRFARDICTVRKKPPVRVTY